MVVMFFNHGKLPPFPLGCRGLHSLPGSPCPQTRCMLAQRDVLEPTHYTLSVIQQRCARHHNPSSRKIGPIGITKERVFLDPVLDTSRTSHPQNARGQGGALNLAYFRVCLGYLRRRQLAEPCGRATALALTHASAAEDSEWGGDLVPEEAFQDPSRELFPLQFERKRNVLRGRQRDHRDEHSLSSMLSTPSLVTGGATEDSGKNFSMKCASLSRTRAAGQPPPQCS